MHVLARKVPFLIEVFQIIKVKEAEAVAKKCSVKKLFLEISQNSQNNTCARVSFLIKLQGLQLY